MAIEEADEEVTTGSPQTGGKGSDNADASHTDTVKDKSALDSPPRSPDGKAKDSNKEKMDDEKDVVLDMSATTEVPLRDSTPAASPLPPVEEDYKTFHRRMLARLLIILLAQWLIAALGGIASAGINGSKSYRNPTYIVLTLLFVAIFVAHLAYLSLTVSDQMASAQRESDEHRAACALQLRVANLAKLLSFTLTLCGVFYALTGCFSQVCFNLIAVSVVMSLGAAVAFVVILPRRAPRVLELLNGSLVATMFAMVLIGSTFSNCFRMDTYTAHHATHPAALAISVVVGVALSAWLLLGVLKALEDETDTKVVQLDFGVSSILAIYAGGINTVWKLAVDQDSLGLA